MEKTKSWKSLCEQYKEKKGGLCIKEMLKDEERSKWVQHITAYGTDIYVDYSRHLVDEQIFDTLIGTARELEIESERDKMFSGSITNTTEGRPVLHMALRCPEYSIAARWAPDVSKVVKRELEKMENLSKTIRAGVWKGYGGEKIKSIVNIGIGGSDLGPRMVCQALQYYASISKETTLDVHFVSNIDGNDLESILRKCHPSTTLFVIVSKTFTTLETLTNARSARNWVLEYFKQDVRSCERHFVAVSTNVKAVVEFGIPNDDEHIFVFWDWVGGRYSLWSAAGLCICLYIGYENFRKLLDGARAVDEHFISTPLSRNVPIILAVLGIWYNNFYDAETRAILPYEQLLSLFPNYLQQLEMESNGKHVTKDGARISINTAQIIWGGVGTDGQHSFFQSLHQGTRIVPCDFLVGLKPCIGKENIIDMKTHHMHLFSNCISQMEALSDGFQAEELHLSVDGNKPSTAILYSTLNPQNLGAILAIYEHKVFVEGKIWGINSYDQWGVELGKKLAKITMGRMVGEEKERTNVQRFIDLYLEYNNE